MENGLTLVKIGRSERLERLLPQALDGLCIAELPPEKLGTEGKRLLFAVSIDAYGPEETFTRLLRPVSAAACAAGA